MVRRSSALLIAPHSYFLNRNFCRLVGCGRLGFYLDELEMPVFLYGLLIRVFLDM